MKTRKGLFALLAWLQLFVSILFAAAIVVGYLTYQASFGQLVTSVGASIQAVSNVVVITAETVEARRDLLDQTAQMLVATKSLIREIQTTAQNQATIAPQYASGLASTASLAGSLSGTLQSLGNAMSVSVPTGIQFNGITPILVMTHPFATPALALQTNAQNLTVVSQSLSNVAATISQDGQNLSLAIVATSAQALKVITEAEKTLAQLNTQDLPKALQELKTTSKNLSTIREQVDIAGNAGWVFLIVGLLLAVWCFLNSLGALTLSNSQGSDLGGKTSSQADS